MTLVAGNAETSLDSFFRISGKKLNVRATALSAGLILAVFYLLLFTYYFLLTISFNPNRWGVFYWV